MIYVLSEAFLCNPTFLLTLIMLIIWRMRSLVGEEMMDRCRGALTGRIHFHLNEFFFANLSAPQVSRRLPDPLFAHLLPVWHHVPILLPEKPLESSLTEIEIFSTRDENFFLSLLIIIPACIISLPGSHKRRASFLLANLKADSELILPLFI